MSWSIEAAGTPDELREAVYRHAHHYWGGIPEAERGAARHAIGHAIDTAAEGTAEGARFLLLAEGHDAPGSSASLSVDVRPLYAAPPVPDPVADAPVLRDS